MTTVAFSADDLTRLTMQALRRHGADEASAARDSAVAAAHERFGAVQR